MNIPQATRGTLASRLSRHAREHWPDLAGVKVRYRAGFAYVDGEIVDDHTVVGRALAVLEVVAECGTDITLAELARVTGTSPNPRRCASLATSSLVGC